MCKQGLLQDFATPSLIKMSALLACAVLLCIALMPAALANTHYFSARAAVDSQSTADRNKALQVALEEVLVKVSGELDVATNESLAKAMANAGRYVQQFRYVKPTEAEQALGANLVLSAEFDPGLVRKIIKESGLGLWPVNRPQVLLWAIEHTPEHGRQLITDPDHPLVAAMLDRAKVRGLPVLLPLWDLDDQFMLSEEQLWQLDGEAVMDASARYDVNTVLAARFSQTSDGEWLASWQFQHAGERQLYDFNTIAEAELALAGVDPVVAYLAERYAVQATDDESELLQVMELQGIESFAQYRAALAYLQQQPLISSVSLVAVRGDVMVLHILLASDWSQLDQALALDRKVHSLNQGLAPWQLAALGAPDVPAQYRWSVR